MANDSLEGLRLTNGECRRCGHNLAGLKIHSGIIVCPACAHVNRFVPARGVFSPRLFRVMRALIVVAMVLTLVGLIWSTVMLVLKG